MNQLKKPHCFIFEIAANKLRQPSVSSWTYWYYGNEGFTLLNLNYLVLLSTFLTYICMFQC